MRCSKHGPIEPCDDDGERGCDPSWPHCPICGRDLLISLNVNLIGDSQ